MSTRKTLQKLIHKELQGVKFIVVSNREPYVHSHKDGDISVSRPAGGLALALDPILQTANGIWIAQGTGDADRETVDEHDHVAVPPEKPSYTLRRVWIDKQLQREFYNGMANEGLWPLCHVSFVRPTFRPRDWESYRRANQIFADAVLEEAGDEAAFVFIQDYHFALLPRMLKQRNPKLTVAQFWHIPWPNAEAFRAFPWKDEILDGLLGNDLFGLQLRYHCTNFLDTIDRNVEAIVNSEHLNVQRAGHETMVRPFPISIDYDAHIRTAFSNEVQMDMEEWRKRLNLDSSPVEFIGIGIDRIDYTKGIPDRLQGFDYFLDLHPEYRGRVQFVQIGVPSRMEILQYQTVSEEVEKMVESINSKWATDTWKPVIFLKQYFTPRQLIALHRLASFCVVTSLHDGMNLVAKEYVASRFDEDGVLILSRFTGAARELTDALLVNPFAINEIAEAIAQAVGMKQEERRKRMRKMRREVEENNIYHWAAHILSQLLRIEIPTVQPDEEEEGK